MEGNTPILITGVDKYGLNINMEVRRPVQQDDFPSWQGALCTSMLVDGRVVNLAEHFLHGAKKQMEVMVRRFFLSTNKPLTEFWLASFFSCYPFPEDPFRDLVASSLAHVGQEWNVPPAAKAYFCVKPSLYVNMASRFQHP